MNNGKMTDLRAIRAGCSPTNLAIRVPVPVIVNLQCTMEKIPRRFVQFKELEWDQEESKSKRGYNLRKNANLSQNKLIELERAKIETQQLRSQVIGFADFLCGDIISNILRQNIVSIPILSSLDCICKHVAMENRKDPNVIIQTVC